jgi:transcriptional regulator with XRE-family HTH domain
VPLGDRQRPAGELPHRLRRLFPPGRQFTVGQAARALRAEEALSRAEVARRVGVPGSTLRHWEGDRGMPGLPVLRRLAEALGVPLERFAEGVEDPAGQE